MLVCTAKGSELLFVLLFRRKPDDFGQGHPSWLVGREPPGAHPESRLGPDKRSGWRSAVPHARPAGATVARLHMLAMVALLAIARVCPQKFANKESTRTT